MADAFNSLKHSMQLQNTKEISFYYLRHLNSLVMLFVFQNSFLNKKRLLNFIKTMLKSFDIL